MSACYCEIDACVLCEARLYPGLTPEQVCHIRGLLIRQTYDPHDILFRDGDPARYLFAVRSGQIKLISSLPDGRQQILHLVVPGQLLGREAFNNRSYAYTAEALSKVSVCKISSRDLQQVLEQNPSMSLRVIQTLIQELDQTEMLVRDLGLKTAPEKVATFILSLVPTRGDKTTEIPLLLSRREMAEMLGLTEETVSRVMAQLNRKKIIHTGKGTLRIAQPKHLYTLAGLEPAAPAFIPDRLIPAS
jgi:CRP/FNR family transcriptional regulator